MRLLAAAIGTEPDDHHGEIIVGELVYSPIACDLDRLGIRACGCGRLFAGLTSGALTTAAVVVDVEMDLDELTAMIRGVLVGGGWNEVDEFARDFAEDAADDGEMFAVGTLVRRWCDEIEAR